jgi:hypothetical protein
LAVAAAVAMFLHIVMALQVVQAEAAVVVHLQMQDLELQDKEITEEDQMQLAVVLELLVEIMVAVQLQDMAAQV